MHSALWMACCTAVLSVAYGDRPPNIILFVIDDLGWGDLAFSNLADDRTSGGHAEYSTPALDRLSSEGIVLNHYYVNQLCSPTRTSLLSSRNAYNLGLANGVITNGHPVALRTNESTIAQHLKHLGYSTHAFGKWDIGYHTWAHTPTYRGFDTYLGYYNADEDYFTHFAGGCGCEKGLDFHKNLLPFNDSTTYSAYLYSQGIIDVIKNSGGPNGNPFFIYGAFQSVHGPLEAPKKYIDECVSEGVLEADRLIFCGMVKALDEGIKNITNALFDAGIGDNTLIGLTTDNGGQNWVGGNNWPLRGNKATIFEGGVRGTGFLWGAMLQQKKTKFDGLMHHTDWGPTLVSAAGGDGGALSKNTTLKLDGVDQWKAINGISSAAPRNEILIHLAGPDNNDASTWSPYSALRIGDWKIVVAIEDCGCKQGNNSGNICLKHATGWVQVKGNARIYNAPNESQTCYPGACLFNLASDPLEKTNLVSSTDPKAVAALAQLRERLAWWNATRVPNQVFGCDLNSCPVHFNGSWMPWLKKDPVMPPVPAPKPDIKSSVSSASVLTGTVSGWVCDHTIEAKATMPCTVYGSINGTKFGNAVANIPRAKVQPLGDCPNPNHGFELKLPAIWKEPGLHRLDLTIITWTNQTVELNNSPICLANGKVTPCKH